MILIAHFNFLIYCSILKVDLYVISSIIFSNKNKDYLHLLLNKYFMHMEQHRYFDNVITLEHKITLLVLISLVLIFYFNNFV
jgi:hypothetical protein